MDIVQYVLFILLSWLDIYYKEKETVYYFFF